MPQITALLARWNALPRAARSIAALGGAAIAAIAIVGGILAHAPQTPLFPAPLHAEQLSEVEERLASWNVAFTPVADNIVVDTGRRNDLLLRLSLAGVPHAHIETTAQALANVNVLTPQAVLDAQARAGLAGDIEEGLRGIDGIDDARAIVVPAKPAEFGDQDARNASASVRLRLRPGARLSRDTIAGIRAFVAASVAGLDPAQVTLLDDGGVALGGASTEGGDGVELERSLQSALDGAFGEGATIVRVHAEYRTSATAERDVQRVPVAGGAIERTSAIEAYDGGGKRYRRHDEHDDGGSESRETFSQTQPGALLRVSTAVFVDRSRIAELAAVRDLAAATVGYDARRGDVLAVQPVAFARPLVARKDTWWLLYGAIVPLLPTLALVLGGLAAGRAGVPPLLRVVRTAVESVAAERASKAVSGLVPSRVRDALAGEPPHAAAAIISALPAATAAAVLELYPTHEREAILRRMQRPHSPLVPDAEELLRRHA